MLYKYQRSQFCVHCAAALQLTVHFFGLLASPTSGTGKSDTTIRLFPITLQWCSVDTMNSAANNSGAQLAIIGSTQIGGLLSVTLFGCLACQTYLYFARFTSDGLALKITVSRPTVHCILLIALCHQVSAIRYVPCLNWFSNGVDTRSAVWFSWASLSA